MVEGRWKRIETKLRYIREQTAGGGTTARLWFGVAVPEAISRLTLPRVSNPGNRRPTGTGRARRLRSLS